MSVGNDITFQLDMSREEVNERFPRNSLLSVVKPMADIFFGARGKVLHFHDSCAATAIFRDDVVQFMGGYIEVELRADALMGMTVVKHAAYLEGRHMNAVSVDRELFYRDFSEVFSV